MSEPVYWDEDYQEGDTPVFGSDVDILDDDEIEGDN